MSPALTAYVKGPIFDGSMVHENHAALFKNGHLHRIVPDTDLDADTACVDLNGDILSPGFTDLQVNGGGGVMLNDEPSVHTIRRISAAHRTLGTVALLPTLITDTAEKTLAAIDAVETAVAENVPGVAGLHLEGPHLSIARKGAHDAAYIRPMDDTDIEALLKAARSLPALMVTVAPESVTKEQVASLRAAGVIVSLGHTDADYKMCREYIAVGAHCATHLFNAMSQLGNREPGLVGAVLGSRDVSSGLIADGIHVHPEVMRTAWAAKTGPGEIFLVSDAMAVAGTEEKHFELGGRKIHRSGGRLTLGDGTLAGADLDLVTAVRVLVNDVGVELGRALRAATTVPDAVIGRNAQKDVGSFIRISSDLTGVSPL
ncbi:MAG: N-acetylglucosamine-6-phosphate deacetylase [Silicimonas sp.]|nr:N-acetylglucosamine-6-phosphate deacetylase [Silicimonas sp.]